MNGTKVEDAQPSSKRKAGDDANPLTKAAKRAKKEAKASSSKRKAPHGEEQAGGLVIIRGPATIPAPAPPPQSSISASIQPSIAGPSKPPSKKLKASSSAPAASTSTSAFTNQQRQRPKAKSKSQAAPPAQTSELAIEEDVRLMDRETESLRKKSQAASLPRSQVAAAINFATPSTSRHTQNWQTPRTERHQAMRELGVDASGGSGRRRASASRGKRLSSCFEQSGIIAQPHKSVSESSFYKHIDADLPESQRARQLLIWCASRSKTSLPSASTSTSKSKTNKPPDAFSDPSDPPLPTLTPEEIAILREVQEETIRMLAEGKIDTSVHPQDQFSTTGHNGKAKEPKSWLTPNEQNVKNRRRRHEFKECIERAEQENGAWGEVEAFYKSYCESYASHSKGKERALSEPAGDREATPERTDPSLNKIRAATPDGKIRRAGTPKRGTTPDIKFPPSTPQPLSREKRWNTRPWDQSKWADEVPAEFLGPEGLALSNSVLDGSRDGLAGGDLADAEFMLDQLETYMYSAAQAVLIGEEMLDHRFGMISQRITAVTAAPPLLTSSSVDDPQDMLRALSRIDIKRPPGEVGDAARRAQREVQRSNGASERRLTNVVASSSGTSLGTPGRRGGTPRRERTPGKGR